MRGVKLSVRGGLAGVAAAAVAVGVAEVVAVLTGPLSAPLIAVGGVVVDNVPGPVKDFGVRVFGVHDKTALIVGTSVLLAAYAYGVGVVALRSWRLAVGGIALFAAVGVAAAVTRHDAGVFAWLPTVAGAALAVWTLRLLLTRAAEEQGAGQDAYGEGRRGFLKGLGIAAGVAAVPGLAGRWLTSRQAVNAARGEVVLPAARQTAPPLPAGVQVPGVTPYVSPNRDFYRIDTALIPPRVDPATWELRIHGMVRNPFTITWEQLLQRPMIERYVTLACVSNEVGGDLIGNALWLGAPIRELLEEAGPLPGADQVVQRSIDGWTCGSPTAALMDGRDALLAVGMNGEPLPVAHGFPVRMVVPGLYGYVSACKWITEIELTRFSDFDAYWVPRGWSAQGPIKTESRIDTPRDGGRRPAGTVVVGGVAWAQHRGITKVEVQVDGGAWSEASLADTVSSDTWRQWSWSWPATAGEHTLRVRATDGAGAVQTSTPAPPAPDGASGWHQISVTVE
ncbi:molybdopterin-dependent oxidoreductase [Paractinoplanes brasiliensis]|uniref:DMSO/TMAO reductase YedYZ molybdopterin-dependent catalytic subunit n=1 Tax=Paractinoplanes brasiliensis TaxID=52695 RepID=A0A4R6JVL9_9ACTN|nr:molybdopterin-dependent oxidoreductase [Actinoplanes brasiliensis]TDO38725.1 DMSO/TMAO reductase YedYZ molybdopterin-dependent catalytic subunit [Actinoplanes brasiliensis]